MLRVKDIACCRNGVELFSDLNFQIEPGQLLHIMGNNGVGKTSLLRLLCGLAKPLRGAIYWQNIPIGHNSADYYQQMAYMAHANAIKLALSPLVNLQLTAALYNSSLSIPQILTQLDLATVMHQPTAMLSAGQRRRVAWARILLQQARLWILDEPFTAVDDKGKQNLIGLINQHLNAAGMVILTAHEKILFNHMQTFTLQSKVV